MSRPLAGLLLLSAVVAGPWSGGWVPAAALASPPAKSTPATRHVPRVKVPDGVIFREPSDDEVRDARRVLYVLDVTSPLGSEKDEASFRHQLATAVGRLKESQAFNVFVVGPSGPQKMAPDFVAATEAGRKRLAAFLDGAKVSPQPVNPVATIAAALAVPAGGRYLLVDHAWTNPAVVVDAFSKAWKAAVGVRILYVVPKGRKVDSFQAEVCEKLAADLGGMVVVREQDGEQKAD